MRQKEIAKPCRNESWRQTWLINRCLIKARKNDEQLKFDAGMPRCLEPVQLMPGFKLYFKKFTIGPSSAPYSSHANRLEESLAATSLATSTPIQPSIQLILVVKEMKSGLSSTPIENKLMTKTWIKTSGDVYVRIYQKKDKLV